MPLGERGPHERGGKRGAPLLKRRYSTAIGSSDVKMVADRHRHAAYDKQALAMNFLEVSTLMTWNDLEPLKYGI